jgi:hypothetical protein
MTISRMTMFNQTSIERTDEVEIDVGAETDGIDAPEIAMIRMMITTTKMMADKPRISVQTMMVVDHVAKGVEKITSEMARVVDDSDSLGSLL